MKDWHLGIAIGTLALPTGKKHTVWGLGSSRSIGGPKQILSRPNHALQITMLTDHDFNFKSEFFTRFQPFYATRSCQHLKMPRNHWETRPFELWLQLVLTSTHSCSHLRVVIGQGANQITCYSCYRVKGCATVFNCGQHGKIRGLTRVRPWRPIWRSPANMKAKTRSHWHARAATPVNCTDV